MKFVQDKERKELLSEFNQRHGRIDKLMDDDNKIIGYLVRADLSSATDKEAEVIVNLSFNVKYFFKAVEREYKKDYQIVDYQQADLKYFAIKAALKKCVSADYCDAPCSAFSWHDERDDVAFSNFMYAEINQRFNDAFDMQKEMHKWEGNSEKFNMYKMNACKRYDELSIYIFKCVKNVLKYYKDKTVRFFFL